MQGEFLLSSARVSDVSTTFNYFELMLGYSHDFCHMVVTIGA